MAAKKAGRKKASRKKTPAKRPGKNRAKSAEASSPDKQGLNRLPKRPVIVDPAKGKTGETYLLAIALLLESFHPKNPRKLMKGAEFEALKALHRKFGCLQPAVVNLRTGRIVGGHQRLRAAQAIGMPSYPTWFVDRDEVEEGEANVGLNISGDWEELLLVEMLEMIKEGDGDLGLTGFDDAELARLLQKAEAGEKPDDSMPEASTVEKRCSPCDVWILGDHRLMCGDSTQADHVDRVLGGEAPNLMVTDPPYGVSYDPQWREDNKIGLWSGGDKTGKVISDDIADWSAAYAHFRGQVVYVWHSGLTAGVFWKTIVAAGFDIRAQIIWAKQISVFGRGAYHWQHEACWYGVRKGGKASWIGDRKQSTIWEIQNANPMGGQKDDGVTHHGTQKPVECMLRPMANHKGDVFDPFLGSGTTIIAAQKLGRRCFGLEISPEYCDVILARWEQFTGLEVVKDDG